MEESIMSELNFLENAQSTADAINPYSGFVSGTFNVVAILGILMACAGIVALIYNKAKKTENNLPFYLGIGGVFVIATAKLSNFLVVFDPTASYSGSPVSPALLFIIICATVYWILDSPSHKNKERK